MDARLAQPVRFLLRPLDPLHGEAVPFVQKEVKYGRRTRGDGELEVFDGITPVYGLKR